MNDQEKLSRRNYFYNQGDTIALVLCISISLMWSFTAIYADTESIVGFIVIISLWGLYYIIKQKAKYIEQLNERLIAHENTIDHLRKCENDSKKLPMDYQKKIEELKPKIFESKSILEKDSPGRITSFKTYKTICLILESKVRIWAYNHCNNGMALSSEEQMINSITKKYKLNKLNKDDIKIIEDNIDLEIEQIGDKYSD